MAVLESTSRTGLDHTVTTHFKTTSSPTIMPRLPFAIVHHALQPLGKTICLSKYNGYCSHLCAPVDLDLTDPDAADALSGAGGVPVVCECPAGMQLLNDTRTCGTSNTSKSTNNVC